MLLLRWLLLLLLLGDSIGGNQDFGLVSVVTSVGLMSTIISRLFCVQEKGII